jgi:hypothetical protein
MKRQEYQERTVSETKVFLEQMAISRPGQSPAEKTASTEIDRKGDATAPILCWNRENNGAPGISKVFPKTRLPNHLHQPMACENFHELWRTLNCTFPVPSKSVPKLSRPSVRP